jgi:hypothetical protein
LSGRHYKEDSIDGGNRIERAVEGNRSVAVISATGDNLSGSYYMRILAEIEN